MKMLNLFNRNSSSTYEACVRSPVQKPLEKELKEFHTAAAKGDLAKLRKLATKKDIAQLNKLNSDALHVACARGHVDVVQFLIEKKAKVNQCDSENRSALMKAVQGQHEQCVSVLLENLAEPNLLDNKGNTALHLAANIPSIPIATLLLQHKANINAQNKKGFTPLIVAVREHYIKMANFLLNKRADVNVIDQDHRSPLMMAAGGGQIDMLELLMRFNANTALKDAKGWTACDYAVKNGFSRCLPLISKKKDNKLDSSKNKQREIIQKGKRGKTSAHCTDKPELTNASRSGSLNQNHRNSPEGGKVETPPNIKPGKMFASRKREVSDAHCTDKPAPHGGPLRGNDQKTKLGWGIASTQHRTPRKPLSKYDPDNIHKSELGLADVDRLSTACNSCNTTSNHCGKDDKNTEKTVSALGRPSSQAGFIHQAREQKFVAVLSKHDSDNKQKTGLGLGTIDELSDWDSPSVTSHDSEDATEQKETEKPLGLMSKQGRIKNPALDLADADELSQPAGAKSLSVWASVHDQKMELGLDAVDELSDWDSPSVSSHDGKAGIKQKETEKALGILSKHDRDHGQKPAATKSSVEATVQSYLPLQLWPNGNKQDGQIGKNIFDLNMVEVADTNNLKKQVDTLKSELAKITTLAAAEREVELCLASHADTKTVQPREKEELQRLRDRLVHSQHSDCEERVQVVEQRTNELASKTAALEDQVHQLKEENHEIESKCKQLADSLRKLSIKEALLEVNIRKCDDLEMEEPRVLKDTDGVKSVRGESKYHFMQCERQMNCLQSSPDESDKYPQKKESKVAVERCMTSQSVFGLHSANTDNVHSGCEEKVQAVEERDKKPSSNTPNLQHQLKKLEEENNETEANLRQLADSLEKMLTSETSLEGNTHYHCGLEKKTKFFRDSGAVLLMLEDSEDHYVQPEKRINRLKSHPGEKETNTTIKRLREAVERLKRKKASAVQDQMFRLGEEKNGTEAKLFYQVDSLRALSMSKASLRVNAHNHNDLEEKTTQLLKLIDRTKTILENDNHHVKPERHITSLKSSLDERDKKLKIKDAADTRLQANSRKMLPISHAFLEVNTNKHNDLQEKTTRLLKLIYRTKGTLDSKDHFVQPERQIVMGKNTTVKQLKDIVERLKKERMGLPLTKLEKGELKMKADSIAEERIVDSYLHTPSETGAAEFVVPVRRHSQAEVSVSRMKGNADNPTEKKTVEEKVISCSSQPVMNQPKRFCCSDVQLERSKDEEMSPRHLRVDNLVQVNLQFQEGCQKAGHQIKVTTKAQEAHELEQNIQRLERELARATSMQYDSLELTTTQQK